MDLSGLLALLEADGDLQALAAALRTPAAPVGVALPRAARAACLAALQRRLGRPLLVVTGSPELRPFHEELQAWCGPEAEVLLLPEPEGLPYERLPAHPAVAGERLATLARLSQVAGTREASGEPALTLALSQRERAFSPPPESRAAFVVTTPRALCQVTVSPERFAAGQREIRPGDRLNLHQLLQTLIALGYEPAPLVESPGTFARRGGLVDIFPPSDAVPCRIELFGDEVESLRLFDPATQRTTGPAACCRITPARELLLGPYPHANPLPQGEGTGSGLPTAFQGNARGDGPSPWLDLEGLKGDGKAQWDRELADLAEGSYFTGADYYLPLVSSSCAVDYLDSGWLVVLDGPAGLDRTAAEVETQAEELRQQMIRRGELPPAFPAPCLPWEAARRSLSEGSLLEIRPWQEGTGCLPMASLSPAPAFAGRLRQLIAETGDLARAGGRVVLLSQQAPRLVEVFQEAGQPLERREGLPAAPAAGSVVVLPASVGEGWVLGASGPHPNPLPEGEGTDGHPFDKQEAGSLPEGEGASPVPPVAKGGVGEVPRLVLLTDHELFGFSKERRVTRRAAVHRDPFLFDFHEGDYVVHMDHGIARFAGVVRLAFGGPEREYLLLVYAEGAKLYVPAEQADRVSRYVGPREGPPALSRLGTGEWARAKRRVRRSVGDLAKDLLALYAERQVAQGRALSPDTVWQQEMESAFPYVETPDQLQVVGEVKGDMEQARPMDRLVCGDVGYGKTEVAIRAAFKAVMDGYQVAVLVPTTVLAMQHRRTFGERLATFPVRIEMLSRFRTEREQAAVVAALREGQVDICIGTHRLLQADVSFQNLGLVIVDEEQRFGVAHKERLKRLRREVDVLTLSATPIPRTLHMALAGVRDMSLLQTPPEDRLPIRTFVAEYDESLIREALLRELDRGGQVFFVHNRVQGIQTVARQLAELVPEARVAVGHGQMPEEELERVMVEFTEGKQDVLVCTTIIESGLDMPNVNTIIVNRADKFGLAQLYQLRGRVGRGANRAYAYLLYRKDRDLTPTAERRLQAIYEARELGAGFQIALKDLEIRGAGNLLGAEQSGQIGAVGFDLYCRLLGEAVATLKGDGIPPAALASDVSVDIPLTRYLPEEYVPDLKQRLEIYRRLGSLVRTADVDALAEELRDRFGPPPEEAANLLLQARLQLLARRAKVDRITQEDGHLVLWLSEAAASRAPLLRHEHIPGLRVGHRQVRLSRQESPPWPQALESALLGLTSAG